MDQFDAAMIAEGVQDATNRERAEAWALLIESGMCWTLQGWFGRAARSIIESGAIDANGVIDWDHPSNADQDAPAEWDDEIVVEVDGEAMIWNEDGGFSPVYTPRSSDDQDPGPVWTKESYIVIDGYTADGDEKAYHNGTSGWQKSYFDTDDSKGRIFKDLQKEHGACTGAMYIDSDNGAVQVGWVFRKLREYENADRAGLTGRDRFFLAETWVEVNPFPG